MQSAQFDPAAYNNALYGSAASSGFDHGASKFHHLSYPGEPEVNCYANYVTPGLHGMQNYNGCREPPTYPETTNFLHTSIMPGFGNANYYKMPNSIMDYTSTTTMIPRSQDSFLMKPLDPLSVTGPQHEFLTSDNAQEDSHHQPHQQQLHHQQQQQLEQQQHNHQENHLQLPSHPSVYSHNSTENELSKINHEHSFFGHQTVKLETPKIEPPHPDYDTSLNQPSPISATSAVTSTPISQQYSPNESKKPQHCELNTSTGSTDFLENKEPSPSINNDTSNENSSEKEVKVEKKDVDESGKPTMSYIALIAKSILESEQRRLNLGSIYNWIEKHYPFYKNKGQGWRNSVRHNLSLNDCFIKAGRCEDGKGNYWAIHPANIQDFMRGDFRQRRRSRRRGRKKECELSNMYHVTNGLTNGYFPSTGSPLTSFNPTALSSIYSPYTDAERRAYRLDEALLRQSMHNPFVKWYQQGVPTPGYGASTSPTSCTSGVYTNTTPVQWPQSYTEANPQAMYPALNSAFPR